MTTYDRLNPLPTGNRNSDDMGMPLTQHVGGLSLQEIAALQATLENTRRERDLLLYWLLRIYPVSTWPDLKHVGDVLHNLGFAPSTDAAIRLLMKPTVVTIAEVRQRWEGGESNASR